MRRISIADTDSFAREVLARIPVHTNRASLVFLKGDLGAGKTTCVQAIARELGVAEYVLSPTYVLMKSYVIPGGAFTRLVHVDLYRLENPEDIRPLKLQELLREPGVLVCVEWPERAEELLPPPDVTIRLSASGTGPDERYSEIV